MGILKPNMAANLRRIRSVLMDDWDPIGVQGVPEAADEYDSYVMPIYCFGSAGMSFLAERLSYKSG
jgi:hypothetical protein